MGSTGSPESSKGNYHSTLRNIHEFSRSQSTLLFHCKCKFLLVHATKEYGGLEANLHSFLTSELYAGECPTLGSARLALRKEVWCPEWALLPVWRFWKR